MLDKLREIDVILRLSLNPLNWRLLWERNSWLVQAEAGPLTLMVIW